ncbi:MAG: metallophosphoesterase [Candidatus Zixiibacteriota bacterium]|nr:MAG: metallophosphoesterase [candidate division Zixibacteria bacterium]
MVQNKVILIFTLVLMFVIVSCSNELPQKPGTARLAEFNDTLYAGNGLPFRFKPAFAGLADSDAAIIYKHVPSWLTADAESLYGTPGSITADTSFAVTVYDGGVTRTRKYKVIMIPVNNPPEITSSASAEATPGIYFCYTAAVDDSDGPAEIVRFDDVPSWLAADGDSLFGVPPDGANDTSFVVFASDGMRTDSRFVSVNMIPSIVVYGDTRTGHDPHQQIVNLIRAIQPSAVFHVGDLVNNGYLQSDWDIFNAIVAGMLSEVEFFPALGNHEHQSQLYFDNFDLPNNEQWYSVDRNRTHFIVLNSCVPIGPSSDQYQWLQADLAGADDSIDFIAAVFHHPPYSTGPHIEDEVGLRDTLVPLFEQYGVDIVFTGHDHDYERSLCGGIYYIVTGGGGAPLRDQARQHPCSELFIKQYHFCRLSMIDGRLIVRIYNINNDLIDQFELSR